MHDRYKSMQSEPSFHGCLLSFSDIILFVFEGSEAMFADLGHFSQLSIKVFKLNNLYWSTGDFHLY